MKKVLLVKLTSMGDLIHALPALTDALRARPGIRFDWVVDEAFAEVPSWHPGVERVITSVHRRWRRQKWQALAGGELLAFHRALNRHDYDAVVDMQNNLKSALITRLRRGERHGMDRESAREYPAHLAYRHRHRVPRGQHAIARQRQLLAQALGYPCPASAPDYGIDPARFPRPAGIALPEAYLVFTHNASWTTKLWPEEHWRRGIALANAGGLDVVLPSGNAEELARARRLAQGNPRAHALPRLSLGETAGVIRHARGALCCDTGLAHLAAMLGTPALTLYGPTDQRLIGTSGPHQGQLLPDGFSCVPCYRRICRFNAPPSAMSACMASLDPERAWRALQSLMQQGREAQAEPSRRPAALDPDFHKG